MIQLLAVRAAIATLKRATRLSDRFSSTMWEILAICFATVFAISALGLRESQKQERTEAATAVVAGHEIAPLALSEWSLYVANNPSAQTRVSQDLNTKQFLFNYEHIAPVPSSAHSVIYFSMATSNVDLTVNPRLANSASGTVGWNESNVAVALSSSDPVNPLRFFRQPPTVIYQPAPKESASLGKEVQSWAQVIGITLAGLCGIAAQVLMWVSLHRKRMEATLLRLEIKKRELEIEQLKIAIDQARNRSG